MADYGDLLTPDDPLFRRVKRAALGASSAFGWYRESAAAWARGEFVRRIDAEDFDPDAIDALFARSRGAQVAVLTRQLQLGHDDVGRRLPSRWAVHIGLVLDGCTHEYLHMKIGSSVELAGLFDVYDVFKLPEEWRLEKWPTFRDIEPPPSVPMATR